MKENFENHWSRRLHSDCSKSWTSSCDDWSVA